MDWRYVKYHGLGNDYLVMDPALFGVDPDPALVRAICDRNRGPGSDGILLGGRSDAGFALRIFNPDGTEAEKSGNGLRIFARHVYETDCEHPRSFIVETKGGRARAEILHDAGRLVRVDMGEARFDATALAASHGLAAADQRGAAAWLDRPDRVEGTEVTLSLVSLGNPHCVVRGIHPDEAAARRLGPRLENDPRFPRRTNVQLLEVRARDAIRIEIWERGAGYTLASGSSSCAAAAVARRLGLVDDRVRVGMAGGELVIDFEKDRVLMTGPVAKVGDGRLAEEFFQDVERAARGGGGDAASEGR